MIICFKAFENRFMNLCLEIFYRFSDDKYVNSIPKTASLYDEKRLQKMNAIMYL